MSMFWQQTKANPKGQFQAVYSLYLGADESCTLPDGPSSAVPFSLYHFNDMHGHIDASIPSMAKRVDAARKQGPVLFMGAGDDHIGTVYDELWGHAPEQFQGDAAYASYSAAGLDVATIGNHELDRDNALLAKALEFADFPVISSNLRDSQHVTLPLAIIGLVEGLRIGVVGVTTTNESIVRRDDDPGCHLIEAETALKPILKALHGHIDTLIVLSHLGYSGPGTIRHIVPYGDVELAAFLSTQNIDVLMLIIGGHSHHLLNVSTPCVHHGVPIAQAAAHGHYLGQVDFAGHKVNASVHKVADLAPWPSFDQAYLQPWRSRLGPVLEQYVAEVDDCDVHDEAVFATNYYGECVLANFMNDAIVAQSQHWPQPVDFAMLNATVLCKGLKTKASLSYADLFAIMPYADQIVVLSLTGAQLIALIESNAQRIARRDNPNFDYWANGFSHFCKGIRYKINAQGQAYDIQFNGDDAQQCTAQSYRLASSNYLAYGKENWAMLRALPQDNTGLVYRNELIEYLKEHGRVYAELDGRLLCD